MSIWTAFFLVLSVVILASPLLSSSDAVRNGSAGGGNNDGRSDRRDQEENELELDLASGRLALEDYEAMTGRKAKRAEGDDGIFPEG